MTLIFELASPYAFGPEEIRPVLEILDGLQELPVPDTSLRRDRHSHMVDLAASSGPEKIEDRWVPGGRLRYLDLHGVLHELEQGAAQDTPRSKLCRKLTMVIGRAGASRRGPRKPRFGEVRAVFGTERVLNVFAPYRGIVPNVEFINLRDESAKGVGFVLDEEHELPPGSLMAIERDEGQGAWQLFEVRWMAAEGNQWLLGAEYLSKYPKRVDIEWETGEAGKETAMALFLPLTNASQGANSNLLVPQVAYMAGRMLMLRQGDGMCYRLKLSGIIATYDPWLRVGFDVLSRETTETQ
jgi:hypothetical protein